MRDRFAGRDQGGAPRVAVAFDLHFRRRRPVAVLGAIGLVHHHALGEQAGERLVEADMAGFFHGAGEEAAIEQMQDRVLDAADILIDRHPRIDHRHVGRRGLDPRIGEALEIPRRVDERVHGVGLAPRRPAALRAGDVLPGRMMIERIARPVEADVVGQGHRQIFFRHRHHAAFGAMDDRDRAAPITLPRNAPVAQPIIDLALRHRAIAVALLLQPPRDFLFRLRNRHAVQKPRIDHAAVAVIGRRR